MRLKFTAILLSSVLVSVSYGAEINEAAGVETVQHVISQKVVPDSFEGVGEYCFKSIAEFRSRRAAVESKLHSFQGQGLEVFTPEIFAEVLEEGIQIAELGLYIFEKLPTVQGHINERLTSLESRMKSENDLISWRELAALIREIKGYPDVYWDEFKLDIEQALRSSKLQPQVFAAHAYTLNQSERWVDVNNKVMNIDFRLDLKTEYGHLIYRINESMAPLLTHKFAEENESIVRAVELTCAALEKRGVIFQYDLRANLSVSEWIFQSFLKREIVVKLDELVLRRNLYINGDDHLSEWICVVQVRNEFRIEDAKVNTDDGFVKFVPSYSPRTEPGSKQTVREIRTKVESVIQTALDETFAWLMTQ